MLSFLLSICAVLTVILPLFLSQPVCAVEDPVITDTQCAYLYNVTNDRLLYAKNLDLKTYPASTVKIMLTLVILENWNESWDKQITVDRSYISGVKGNSIGLRSEEIISFRDLINCVVVAGANDCAYVLVYEIFGDIQPCLDLMNQKAQELGMKNTYYTNITGMHDAEMVTTLEDVATLAKYALTQYTYYEMTHQYKYIVANTNKSGSRVVYTRNHFMTSAYTNLYYRSDVDGMNAGSTNEAGYCAVVTAENSGTCYLAIAMGSGSDGSNIYAFTTIGSMLDWAYENFRYVTVAKDTEVIREIPVKMSAGVDHISVLPKNTVEVFMEGDVDVDTEVKRTVVMTKESLVAPVKIGEVVGYVTFSYKDEVVGRVELVTKNTIARSETLYFLSLIGGFFTSKAFIAVAVIAACMGIFYVIIKAKAIGDEKKAAKRKAVMSAGRRNINR